jgi:hypoxanthine phosphoribosyltransferase
MNIIKSSLKNKKIDISLSLAAKQRSIHNNYSTFLVLFIMLSGHYSFLVYHKYNWLILCAIAIISATARHYFNLRGRKIINNSILIISISAFIFLALLIFIFKPYRGHQITMSEKLSVSWEDYNNTVERLAVQIYDSGYKPTLLVGIMRGGAPMIDVLSRVFKLKCAYLAVESYSGKGVEDEQGEIVFSREMSSIAKNMGGNILLCDDLSDTGITLNKSVDWLKKYEPIKDKINEIKTATLWKKQKSTFDPDYCAVKLENNPWIVQPFEVYEEIQIEDIKKKHQK